MSDVASQNWFLGYRDRGHGHGDYAVLSDGGIVVECLDRETAEHIILAHRLLPLLCTALKDLHSVHRAFSGNENWTSLDDAVREQAEKAIAEAEVKP